MKKILYIRQNRGFTLIELIVVIAILGVLAAVLVPSIGNYVTKANLAKYKTDVSYVYDASRLIIDSHNSVEEGSYIGNTYDLIDALYNERNITVGCSEPDLGETAEKVYVYYELNVLVVSFYDGDVIKLSKQDGVFTEY